jgi:uncharacterized protein YoaH (UPF0181 family)
VQQLNELDADVHAGEKKAGMTQSESIPSGDRKSVDAEYERRASLVNKAASSAQKQAMSDMEAGDERLFLNLIKEPVSSASIDKALELVVNQVEGDRSQLPDSVYEYAQRKGWMKGYERVTKRVERLAESVLKEYHSQEEIGAAVEHELMNKGLSLKDAIKKVSQEFGEPESLVKQKFSKYNDQQIAHYGNEERVHKDGPTDEEVNDMAWRMFKQHWNALGTEEMNAIYKKLGYPKLAESLKEGVADEALDKIHGEVNRVYERYDAGMLDAYNAAIKVRVACKDFLAVPIQKESFKEGSNYQYWTFRIAAGDSDAADIGWEDPGEAEGYKAYLRGLKTPEASKLSRAIDSRARKYAKILADLENDFKNLMKAKFPSSIKKALQDRAQAAKDWVHPATGKPDLNGIIDFSNVIQDGLEYAQEQNIAVSGVSDPGKYNSRINELRMIRELSDAEMKQLAKDAINKKESVHTEASWKPPSSPKEGDKYKHDGNTYEWDGYMWVDFDNAPRGPVLIKHSVSKRIERLNEAIVRKEAADARDVEDVITELYKKGYSDAAIAIKLNIKISRVEETTGALQAKGVKRQEKVKR